MPIYFKGGIMSIGNNSNLPIDPATGAVETAEQSSILPLFQYHFIIEEKTDISLAANTNVDDEVLTLSESHGFTVGKTIVIWEGSRMIQEDIVAIDVDGNPNKVKISTPLDYPFTAAGAKVVRGECNLAVNGSPTEPITAIFSPKAGPIPVDLNQVIIHIDSSTAGDDGKFGGIAALTNGMYFRKENSETFNLGNYKRHRDFLDHFFKVEYIPSAQGQGGQDSTRITLNLKDTYTQEIRNSFNASDTIKCVIRDNITAGNVNTTMRISIGGSYTSGEV